ncbi:hypothetical protein VB711_25670 [Cronbergia sp. UHCC 0137]|uniref:hypothetical protein n=1 Tax=Cronbergia sp. UHCC 0137 TaxID=3110239 RepID=UPI002B1F9923|nr:hypothetical protein [Cronbergia sp. UHCC 0137]MEA5621197.1 hypothetical protein [Cronbergia sp. UHCC 0137]
MKITTHIGNDGILKVELPAEFANQELEIVIVFQPVIEKSSLSSKPTNAHTNNHKGGNFCL